jgi:hypothetical protein
VISHNIVSFCSLQCVHGRTVQVLAARHSYLPKCFSDMPPISGQARRNHPTRKSGNDVHEVADAGPECKGGCASKEGKSFSCSEPPAHQPLSNVYRTVEIRPTPKNFSTSLHNALHRNPHCFRPDFVISCDSGSGEPFPHEDFSELPISSIHPDSTRRRRFAKRVGKHESWAVPLVHTDQCVEQNALSDERPLTRKWGR